MWKRPRLCLVEGIGPGPKTRAKTAEHLSHRRVLDGGVPVIEKPVVEGKDRRTRHSSVFLRMFVSVSLLLIFVMIGINVYWRYDLPGVIPGVETRDGSLLFLTDSALRRYALYENNRYPDTLTQLVPRFLPLGPPEARLLAAMNYERDAVSGYLLSLIGAHEAVPELTMTCEGIKLRSQ